jgi:hypothetical protein
MTLVTLVRVVEKCGEEHVAVFANQSEAEAFVIKARAADAESVQTFMTGVGVAFIKTIDSAFWDHRAICEMSKTVDELKRPVSKVGPR